MRMLIVGSGGREHALAWKCAQSRQVTRLFVAPGNAGTALEKKTENIHINPLDVDGLCEFAQQAGVDLTLIGPEAPLAAGIVDRFRENQLLCLGPTQYAAQLESSKFFSKTFMQTQGIPTATAASFTDAKEAMAYVQKITMPCVIKADGLAAGKGVIIANHIKEAEEAIFQLLVKQQFGLASQRIVIEDYVEGQEVSFIVLTDGTSLVSLPTAQDHKTRDENDQGPNTGGMGAYSPTTLISPSLEKQILTDIIEPTLSAMREAGHPYTGFLYAGLMITKENRPVVLEFNCRLGDPEAQTILMRLRSDLPSLCLAACKQQLDKTSIQWDPRASLCVVMAAKGYPSDFPTGDIIEGIECIQTPDLKVFHAGTQQQGKHIVSQGGRVLSVCALGNNLSTAREKVYNNIGKITWANSYYRKDIGSRGLQQDAAMVN